MGFTNLKRGSQGNEVKKVQQWLVDNGYNVGKTGVDGKLGPNTESAIMQAQSDNGWKVDGIVGQETWSGMFTPKTVETHIAKRKFIMIIVCHSTKQSFSATEHFIINLLLAIITALNKNRVVIYFNNTAAFKVTVIVEALH